ncbi:MAG: 2-dehydropantoate 2-reductase [Thermodesulfobacteriota bacterium]
MKILIVGCGAIGKLFGVKLARGGHAVLFLDRDPEIVKAINLNGIQLIKLRDEDPETDAPIRLPATADGASVDSCDLCILAVKGYSTAAATRSIRHLVSRESPILTIQTGLGNIETMAEIIDRSYILGGVTYLGATSLSGSKIRHAGVGQTLIGELEGSMTERVKEVKKAFDASGVRTEVSDNIVSHIWSKTLVYAAINPLTAMLRLKNGHLVQKMESIALAKRLIDEGRLVAQGYGVQLPQVDPYDLFLEVCRNTEENLSPMLQDILSSRLTEVESLNGAIHNLGKLRGISTPLHQAMTEFIHLLEKWGSGRDYGA